MIKKIAMEVLSLLTIAAILVGLKNFFPVANAEMPVYSQGSYSKTTAVKHSDEKGKEKNTKKKTKIGKNTQAKAEKENFILNINTSTVEELTAIKGIGEKTAAKIIAYREQNGKFKSKEEIMAVKGIGEKKYEKIKVYICINNENDNLNKKMSN